MNVCDSVSSTFLDKGAVSGGWVSFLHELDKFSTHSGAKVQKLRYVHFMSGQFFSQTVPGVVIMDCLDRRGLRFLLLSPHIFALLLLVHSEPLGEQFQCLGVGPIGCSSWGGWAGLVVDGILFLVVMHRKVLNLWFLGVPSMVWFLR